MQGINEQSKLLKELIVYLLLIIKKYPSTCKYYRKVYKSAYVRDPVFVTRPQYLY